MVVWHSESLSWLLPKDVAITHKLMEMTTTDESTVLTLAGENSECMSVVKIIKSLTSNEFFQRLLIQPKYTGLTCLLNACSNVPLDKELFELLMPEDETARIKYLFACDENNQSIIYHSLTHPNATNPLGNIKFLKSCIPGHIWSKLLAMKNKVMLY